MFKRALTVLVVCALIGALFVLPARVLAESLTVTFDEGGYTYTILAGTLVNEMAGHGNTLKRGQGPPNTQAKVRIDLPGLSTVTHVCLSAYKNAGPPQSLGRGLSLYDASDNRLSYTFGNPSTYYLNYENSTSYEWSTPCADVNVAGVSYVTAELDSNGAFTAHLDNIVITYTSDSPTITPSMSPTPTATYTLSPIGVPYPTCVLLGNSAATFYNFPGSWQRLLGSASANPPGRDTSVIIPREESISLPLKLIPTHRYSTLVYWQITAVDSRQYFEVVLGNTPTYGIAMEEDTLEHSYTIPVGNYSSDSQGNYNLVISVPNLFNEPGLQVNYICVVDETPSKNGTGTTDDTSPNVESCAVCIYAPVGDLFQDFPKIASWAWCSLRRLVECVLLGIFTGIWVAIVKIIMFFASIISWLIRTAFEIYDFLTGTSLSLARYVGGTISNAATTGANAIVTSGLPNVETSIRDTINNLPIAIQNVFYQGLGMINLLLNSGTDALSLILALIRFFLQSIAMLINIVPQLFVVWVQAFNATASGTIAGMPTCNTPDSLMYYYCLGLYVAENTVFSGPAFYLLPIFETVLLWNTIIWTVSKFQKAFSGNA
jgi:hypothetical protein